METLVGEDTIRKIIQSSYGLFRLGNWDPRRCRPLAKFHGLLDMYHWYFIAELPLMLNASLCAQCTMRPNKQNVWVWSRERFTAGPRKETRELMLKKLNSLIVCKRGFYRQDLGCRLQRVWLSSDWLAVGGYFRNLKYQLSGSNQSEFQGLVTAQPEVSISTAGPQLLWKNPELCIRLFCPSPASPEGTRICPITALVFLDCFSLASAFPHSPD